MYVEPVGPFHSAGSVLAQVIQGAAVRRYQGFPVLSIIAGQLGIQPALDVIGPDIAGHRGAMVFPQVILVTFPVMEHQQVTACVEVRIECWRGE